MAMDDRRSRGLLRALVLVMAGLVIAVVLLLAPEWLVNFRGLGDELSPADRVKAVTEERRSILALLAAIGAAIGLYYTRLRHDLDRDSNRTDRYTRAVEQLGHGSPDVQLGGIYALERIALDSVRDRGVISEVLSAFIREHTKADPGPDSKDFATSPTTVVRAALTVLARRPSSDPTYPAVDLNGAGLAGADLKQARLALAGLTGADLTGANLFRADLTDAHLAGANLTRADLLGAYLTGADLIGADLTGASLLDAYLTGAYLSDADLTAVTLAGADLTGARLQRADLTNANLAGADLTGAGLASANLTGANLTAANLTRADLTGANLTGANLTRANLSLANLVDANLTEEQRRAAGR